MQKRLNKNFFVFVVFMAACHPCPNGGVQEGDACYQLPQVRVLADDDGDSIKANEMLLQNLNEDRVPDLVFFNIHEDLLATSFIERSFYVLLRSQPGGALIRNEIGGPFFFIFDKIFVDTNDDQLLDLLVIGAGFSEGETTIAISINQGDGRFVEAEQFVVSGSFVEVSAGDLNRDGAFDLVLGGGNPGTANKVLLSDGQGNFEETLPVPSSNATTLDLFDLNNDGSLDILTMQDTQDQIQTLLNGGDGIFVLQQSLVTGVDPDKFFVVDFDADNDVDLVTINNGENSFEFFENDGGGFFSSQEKFPSLSETRAGLVVDVNGDHRADLVEPSKITILREVDDGLFAKEEEVVVSGLRILAQQNGAFPRAQELQTGLLSEASSVVVTDINQDGTPDFICLELQDEEASVVSFLVSLP